MMARKRVAVVGAGASGLSAVKCCLEEGLEPVCFERTGGIGGLWCYTPEVRPDQACVMKSTVINTSKEVMCFSDFPVPREYAVFMHNTKVLEYFHSYARAFRLLDCMQFHTCVTRVERAEGFKETGQWLVSVTRDGKESTQVFDAVILCTGHHANKYVPQLAGADTFKGRVLHTCEYKDTQGFEDLRVLVVGSGTSSGEAAVELSKAAKQVYLSSRRGTWIVNKLGERGLPADLSLSTRFSVQMAKWMGPDRLNNLVEKQLTEKFDHQLYGLKPRHRFTEQHPVVNDELPHRIACGSVEVKPDIACLTEGGVQFVDNTYADIDVILYATGYLIQFPFLEKKVLDICDNVVPLYKYVFPPSLRPCSLAVVGLVQPLGSTISMAEMQSRWVARVLAGECKLPAADVMWADVERKQAETRARYVNSQRHTIQVDWIPYMDDIATRIGCKPNISRLLWSDPHLAWSLYFGPCTPLHYRLTGPGKWSGARQAILETWDRIYAPLRGTPTPRQSHAKTAGVGMVVTVVVGILVRVWLLT